MKKGKDLKPHIGIFGRRNNGKSSLINYLAKQDIAIVSDVAGTTTDPVKKSMEIQGIGPVILVDTAGIDDSGDLGNMRVSKSLKILEQIDLALMVITNNQFDYHEKNLIDKFNYYRIPFLIIHNKEDLQTLTEDRYRTILAETSVAPIAISINGRIDKQREKLINLMKQTIPATVWKKPPLLGDLVKHGDIVLLIAPIDIEAPEGRLILPQVQTIRDVLDNDCTAIVLKEREVDSFLRTTKIKPALVVTDSQVFLKADASISRDIPLTSFSILLARQKGDFYEYINGTPKIDDLEDGSRVLLLESCTHHVSCDDIGRVKIPRWISNFTGKDIKYETVAGLDNLPRPMDEYDLVIQCGGCMITQKQLQNRLRSAIENKIPVTNYGMAIAYVQGIFKRAVAPFLKAHQSLESDYL